MGVEAQPVEGTWKPGPARVSNAHLKSGNQTLFYIERNKNANTVFYDANFIRPGVLDPDKPIDVYYILYAVDGKRQNLSMVERMLAYGYDAEQTSDNKFKIKLKAFPKRPIELSVDKQGKAQAFIRIKGDRCRLQRIYVKAKPSLYTSVEYVELLGESSDHATPLIEKVVKK